MRNIAIKVCGMRESQNIRDLAKLNPDYIGFIFFGKSKRDVTNNLQEADLEHLPKSIKKVGVFVNATFEEILQQVVSYKLDAVQLHGNESTELCLKIRNRGADVIKAFSVDSSFDFSVTIPYKTCCDYFLFDTKGEDAGGNGFTFDWSILDKYDNEIPFLLSGGLDDTNIAEVNKLTHLNIHAVDVNSKFELKPALKNISLLKESVFKVIK
jgi:phosphoribosylanthranilate isomerase